MSKNWNHDRAVKHIDRKIKAIEDVTVKEYTRDMSLESIKTNAAYRVDGVHMYADLLNFDDMLNVTDIEGEVCHKRTLRFMDQHYRAVKRILKAVDARRVDFHGQRLHSLFTKPYNTEENAEANRLHKAIATAQLIIEVLDKTSDSDEQIPAAKVRIGIDTGLALAVNNGRSGHREPLFLGDPANHAAKLASNNSTKGIYLSNEARRVLGLETKESPERTSLKAEEIKTSQEAAKLDLDVDSIVKDWHDDLDKNPIGAYQFTRQTPPLSDMDISVLTPANSKRQEMVSIYADIDGFTAYVAEHIEDNTEDVIITLHVIRSELERVLTAEFSGRRIRFIGDCLHGVFCEGTSMTTDREKSVSEATRLVGALRSSFDLAIERLQEHNCETGDLGLSIGFDLGSVTVTRLGKQGDRIRCAIGRKVIEAENRQVSCKGNETAIGQAAYDASSAAVQTLFGKSLKVANLDYVEATDYLAENGDASAKLARESAYGLTIPALIKIDSREVRPHSVTPKIKSDWI